ncbi:MAG: hypothetical protein WAP03_25420 [Methylorubrum rhodinum]|uniref:hypothetical protein n=1 Tax=Methylorubrum rhodinum TaxID=29428 RepID=UPI003BAF331C
MAAGRKKPIDWAGIERDFRAGSMSNREIGAWYDVSEGAIRKRAKTEGWVRSGTQDAPCVPVADLIASYVPASALALPETATIVDAGREIAERLLSELDTVVGKRGDLEEAIEAFTIGDRDGGKRRAVMLRAIALPSNAATLRTIASALKTLGEVKHGATQDDADSAADAARKAEDDDPMSAFIQ